MNFMSVVEKQWKLVLGLFILIIAAGGVMTFVAIQNTAKEQKAQESYFLAEKTFLEIKNKNAAPTDPADKAKKPAVAPTAADYAGSKTAFEKIIQDFPKSKASQMAALYLSKILIVEKNPDQALATLQKVENNDSGLVNTLVQQQIGNMQADKNDCPEAVKTWQKIVTRKDASFLHSDIKIQQALCYQKMNDTKKAEELLTNLANQKPEGLEASAVSKEAEKYLRLIQFKKASGT